VAAAYYWPKKDEITRAEFDDEFLNLNKWTQPPSGWSVDPNEGKGRLVIQEQPRVGCASGVVYEDFNMSFNLKLLNNGGAAWALRADSSGDNYYLFYLSGPEGQYANKFVTYIVRGGAIDLKSERTSEVLVELKQGSQYKINVAAQGNTITHTITPPPKMGKPVTPLGLFTDPRKTFPRGGICFRTLKGEKFSIDDLYARPPEIRTPE
jgi:hypothetical protein